MAKRKRLTPPRSEFLGNPPENPPEVPQDLEVKSAYPLGVAPTRTMPPAGAQAPGQGVAASPRVSPPIAGVAGEASATAALAEVSAELEAARNEGRLVQALSLNQVQLDYLVRDRLEGAEEEMQRLMDSLSARGQQTPIEVVDLGAGRFGLISGWRRLTALRRLSDQTGEARFATVQALIRRPASAGDAYVAMIEENEIRLGLSYFERARIVQRAVQQGVYETVPQALGQLFASASRAKRSKIKSFLPLVEQLEAQLRFPAAIGERLGLELSARLKQDPGFAATLAAALSEGKSESVEAEQRLIQRVLSGPKTSPKPSPKGEEIRPGVWLQHSKSGLQLQGPGLTEDHIAAIRKLLQDG